MICRILIQQFLSSKRKAGRPSRAEELEIKLTLWPYFMDGWKAIDAAEDTGIHVNTVKRYFRIWSAKIFKNEEKEFFRACKTAKENALLKLEKRLRKLETHSDRIENKLELIDWSFSPEYDSLHSIYDKLQTQIAKWNQKYTI